MSNPAGMAIIGAVIGIAIGYGVWHAAPAAQPPDTTGAYQIIRQNDYLSFLVDTKTGKTWVWTRMLDDKGKFIDSEWQPAMVPWQ